MSRLSAWNTPFSSAPWPSVSVISGRNLKDTRIFVTADRDFVIRFEKILGLKVCDESYDKNSRFHIDRDKENLCSYLWLDSPWLTEFTHESAEAVEGGRLTHYLLLGGDYNVEVLAVGAVQIDVV